MKMTHWIVFGVVFTSVVVALISLLGSSSWAETEGLILDSSIKVNRYSGMNNPVAEGRRLVDYDIVLKYGYSVSGVDYVGDRLHAGLSNNTTDKALVDQLIEKFAKGNSVTVYYDQNNPSNSSLESIKNVSIFGRIVIVFSVLIGFSLLGGGLYLFNKYL